MVPPPEFDRRQLSVRPVTIGFHVRRAQDRPLAELLDLARFADGLGYNTIWVSEAWGRDAFGLLTAFACTTDHASLATGIVNAWSRTPATLAQAIATLDEVSGGRAVLGLGVSGPRVVEGWHGLAWADPIGRLRHATAVVRSVLAGDRVDGFKLQFQPVRPAVPIYWGAFGTRSIEAAGEVADGWLAGEVPVDRFHELAAPFRRGAAGADRDVPSVSFMLQLSVAETDEEHQRARERLRRDVTFRVGGLGAFHRAALAEQGFAQACDEVAVRWAAGDRDGATNAVTEEILDAMGFVGGAAEACAYVVRAHAAGADEPVVTVPRGTPTEIIASTLEAVAGALHTHAHSSRQPATGGRQV